MTTTEVRGVAQRSSASDRAALERICQLAVNSLGVTAAAIYGFGDDGRWQSMAATERFPASSEAKESMREVVGGAVFRIVEDLREDEALCVHPWTEEGVRIRSVASAPVADEIDGDLLGHLVVVDREEATERSFDEGLLGDIASTAGDLLELQRMRRGTDCPRAERESDGGKNDRRALISDLRGSNRKLEQFAYVASHDLQEPLRMVTGFLSLLKDEYGGQLDAEADEYIEFAVDGARRMKGMIRDLLTYARVGASEEPFVDVDAGSVFAAACDEVLENSSVDADIDVGDSFPVVPARVDQLQRLFTNLLTNAIKYSGGAPRVEVWSRSHEEHHLFAVVDQGVGIPEAQQERIFDLFVSSSDEDSEDSSGIGLAICQSIVEEHGGRLWVESVPGEGASFYFTIAKRALR